MVVVETHPIQYHAPVWRRLAEHHGVRVVVIYASDHSVRGYKDAEFGVSFAWDVDLLAGYTAIFLKHAPGEASQPAAGVWAARGLGRALAKVRPDAVLLVGYSPGFHQVAWLQVIRSRLPLIFRGEVTDHAQVRSPAKGAVRDRVLRTAYRRCAQICYVGQRSLAHYQRLGVAPGKLSFSPYCVDDSVFRAGEEDRSHLRTRTRSELGIPAGASVLLFSGKLSERKDPEILLRAMTHLDVADPGPYVVIFLGEGRLRAALEDQAAAIGACRVRFVGFRNQREMSPFFHAADVLVLPSRQSETWGLVVNEALAHGLPCVVSDAVGCAADLVESGLTGEVFPAGDVRALADSLTRVFKWRAGVSTREACRSRVAGYGVPAAAAGIAEALHRLGPWRRGP